MSAFTNATASSGILRSEIPQLFFTEVKTSLFGMLNSFCSKRAKWKTVISRINAWSEEEVEDELMGIRLEHPDVEKDFQYTVLKAIKTISTRNGNKDARIKAHKLHKLSLLEFYRDFVQRILDNSNMQTSGLYMALRPSDREILARDAFRQTLFAHSRDMFDELVDASSTVPSIVPSVVQSVVQSVVPSVTQSNSKFIEPEDSVSQAPSEIISIRAKEDERLTESILKLHNSVSGDKKLAAGGDSKVSRKSYQRIPSAKLVNIEGRTQTSRKTGVIECDIQTEAHSKRPRSHFTRSQRATKVSIDPCFFEDDGIDVRTAEVGTTVNR